MPSRQNIRKVVTPVEIMGEDAYVTVKSINMQEAKELRNKSVAIDDETRSERDETLKEYAEKNKLEVDKMTDDEIGLAIYGTPVYEKIEKFRRGFYADYVLDWNWVTEKDDENGNPIPMAKPHKNPDAFSTLTPAEFSHISSLFEVDNKNEKN